MFTKKKAYVLSQKINGINLPNCLTDKIDSNLNSIVQCNVTSFYSFVKKYLCPFGLSNFIEISSKFEIEYSNSSTLLSVKTLMTVSMMMDQEL